MKTKIILLTFAVIVFMFNSCDKLEFGNEFLEKEPSGGDVTKDTIFSKVELAKRYLTSGYATLPYGLPITQFQKGNKVGNDVLEAMTDLNNSYLSFGAMFKFYYYNTQYGAGVENDFPWDTKYNFIREGSWDGIRIGWTFLENADKIPDASVEVIRQLKGEAKMIIALHYCDMYRHFGGLPLVDRVYSASSSPTIERATSLETMNFIEKIINEAIEDLPWEITNPNDDGRFTKASAMGLKARLLLFGASPLFNDGVAYHPLADELTWHGKKDKALWVKAAKAAKDLLDMIDQEGGYALINTGNPRQDFQDAYYKRGKAGESLISTRVRFNGLDYWNQSYWFTAAAGGYGITCPTKEYVDMFPMDNGLETTDPNSGWDPNYPWANRDPRLYETVLVNGDPQFQGRTAELFQFGDGSDKSKNGRDTQDGSPTFQTGFKLRKFILDSDRNFSRTQGLPVHWPYLRLAEIYLSYAEALNEANDGPTPEAFEAVNIVRRRVKLGDLNPNLDQLGFRNAVLKERACEFGFEEVRWYDVIRWKMENVFKNQLSGVLVKTTNPENTTFSYETTKLRKRKWSEDFDTKWYLSAFPSGEVNKGYGLKQNPGW